jgi:hypothetical protein
LVFFQLHKMKFLPITIICILLIGCDRGLEPTPPADLGFAGTVYFTGQWPPSDSIVSLWVFASQVYPLDSTKVISGLLFTPRMIFLYPSMSQSLPINTDSIDYSFLLPAGTYKYVGVIQQISAISNGIRAFRVVGFYPDSINNSQPGLVVVNEKEQVKGITINVDFDNPPPQPF